MGFKKRTLIFTLIFGIILISLFFIITGAITKYTGFSVIDDDSNFKKCLEEQNIILYIHTYDSAETLNKLDFEIKNFLSHIHIINCIRDNKICSDKQIFSFPSWIIKDKKIEGEITIKELSEFSGCKMNK